MENNLLLGDMVHLSRCFVTIKNPGLETLQIVCVCVCLCVCVCMHERKCVFIYNYVSALYKYFMYFLCVIVLFNAYSLYLRIGDIQGGCYWLMALVFCDYRLDSNL